MKTIYTKQLLENKKESQLIEKAKGFLKKIREVFKDHWPVQKMIDGLKDEEAEKLLAQEALRSIFSGQDLEETAQIEEEPSETKLRINDAIAKAKKVRIGYFTYIYNTYIERIILPLYTKFARTTGNTILVAWCEDFSDYRAFIIDNIVFVEDLDRKF